MKLNEVKENDIFKNMKLSGWCKNGIFTAHITDNCLYLTDTFWISDDTPILINNDEDLSEFTFIANVDELERVGNADDYDYDDLFYLTFNSGGWDYGAHYYIKKGTKPNKKLIYKRLLANVVDAKNNYNYAKEELNTFLKDNPMISEVKE